MFSLPLEVEGWLRPSVLYGLPEKLDPVENSYIHQSTHSINLLQRWMDFGAIFAQFHNKSYVTSLFKLLMDRHFYNARRRVLQKI
jgi:hypothetical protein